MKLTIKNMNVANNFRYRIFTKITYLKLNQNKRNIAVSLSSRREREMYKKIISLSLFIHT